MTNITFKIGRETGKREWEMLNKEFENMKKKGIKSIKSVNRIRIR